MNLRAKRLIEALGAFYLSVRTINNTDLHFSTQVVELARTPIQEFQPSTLTLARI